MFRTRTRCVLFSWVWCHVVRGVPTTTDQDSTPGRPTQALIQADPNPSLTQADPNPSNTQADPQPPKEGSMT